MATRRFPLRSASIALFAAVALGGCSYGYGGYGGGVSVGYGTSGYYDDTYYSGYASNPYWGWNSGYYYPGTGYYVYDSNRRPHRWSSTSGIGPTAKLTVAAAGIAAIRENWMTSSRWRADRRLR